MNKELSVYNTLSGQKELFKPLNTPFVGMYVCGPTVYSDVHLGNCRTFISFDLINRYLKQLEFKVRYVRNITDAGHLENDADSGEDKISKKARLEQLEPMEIVQRYTLDFHKVMAQFNALPPDIEPTATGHIVEQIGMVQKIIDNGLAYVVNGSVYFDVNKYNSSNNYGELSGRNIEELIAGAGTRELDGQEEKRSAVDFAIWKKASPEHIMRWNSPWGEGFPGWHMECSVMSGKYLGEQFDIHGGGMDLKFPHHECEIAQSNAATGKAPVKYWLHANMLTLNGKRMSKSTGNTLLPEELFAGSSDLLNKAYSPMVVRFFMMQAHYRSTLDFSSEALSAAEKGFDKLMTAVYLLRELPTSATSTKDVNALITRFYEAMNDDFNSPILIAHLFDAVKFINSVQAGKETVTSEDKALLLSQMNAFVFDVLGLHISTEEKSDNQTEVVNGLMETIIDIRKKAKEGKDYEMADQIRASLTKLNIEIKDSREGTSWKFEDPS